LKLIENSRIIEQTNELLATNSRNPMILR